MLGLGTGKSCWGNFNHNRYLLAQEQMLAIISPVIINWILVILHRFTFRTKSDFVRVFSGIEHWGWSHLGSVGWVGSTIAPSLHTAHAYIHNTVKLTSIILSITGGFYQQCWHSIIGQRLSIICQCLVGMAYQEVCKHNNEDMTWQWRFWGQKKT